MATNKIELDREAALALVEAHDRFLSVLADAIRGIIAEKEREHLERWFEDEDHG